MLAQHVQSLGFNPIAVETGRGDIITCNAHFGEMETGGDEKLRDSFYYIVSLRPAGAT